MQGVVLGLCWGEGSGDGMVQSVIMNNVCCKSVYVCVGRETSKNPN